MACWNFDFRPVWPAVFKTPGLTAAQSIKIRAHGSDGIEIPATTATVNNGYTTLPLTPSTTGLPDTIKYYNRNDGSAFTLTWEMSFDGGGTWIELGGTKHTVYLTFADSLTSLRQESLFNLGSRQANGLGGMVSDPSDRAAITEAVWQDFSSRNVRRIDGTQLTYYGSFLTTITSTQDLLATGDGQCGSWAKLFLDVRKVQGIADIDNYVVVAPLQPNPLKGFMVATWSFSEPGQSGHQEYPYLGIPGIPFINPVSYNWRYSEVSDDIGIEGQGSPNPHSLFNNHQVVFVNSQYYDPSYGVKYTDLPNIEATAIVGFYIIEADYPVDETTVNLDLNGDGDMTDLGVPTLVRLFRRNGQGLDIAEVLRTTY